VQKTSTAAFMSKYCQYTVHQQNFTDITFATEQNTSVNF